MARTPYSNHFRHRQFDRVRYSQRLLEWLSAQATRLSTTIEAVYHALFSLSPKEIEAVANIDIPANTVAPAITGTAQVGQLLTVSNGTWTGTPTPTYSYQWNRAGVVIVGAEAATYTPTASDVGSTITATVTAHNIGGDVSTTSAATAAVVS